MEATGALVELPLTQDSHLVRASREAEVLISTLPYVKSIGPYTPDQRVQPELWKPSPSKGQVRIIASLLDESTAAAFDDVVRRARGSVIAYHEGAGLDSAIALVPRGAVRRLAAYTELLWMERDLPNAPTNVDSAWVGQSGAPTVPFFPSWESMPVWRRGIYGQGQIVAVQDSGLDYDHGMFRDPEGDPPGASHRKVAGYDSTTTSCGDGLDDDIVGHGTHVSGSVAADAGTIGQPDSFDGMAPAARLWFYDVEPYNNLASFCPDTGASFTLAYAAGARIHTNSWGCPSCGNVYNTNSVNVDNFMWNNKDMLITISAGNEGNAANAVRPPGTAKNALTVGAAVNDWEEQNADFSSHGPVNDGRRKPDLTAPGVSIVSADSDADLSTNNDGLQTMDGTSMSTPTTAGYAALVRQYYVDGWYPTGSKTPADGFTPSGDLMKATLVNSAGQIDFEYGGASGATPGTIPTNGQGWGKVRLDDALYFQGDDRRLIVLRNGLFSPPGGALNFTASGQVHTFLVHAGSKLPLKVTLAYTDVPGSAADAAAADLRNNLNLEVTTPGGTNYRGNLFMGGYSTTGVTTDVLNNSEQVYLPPSALGDGIYTVTVRAPTITSGPQPYALIASGEIFNSTRISTPSGPYRSTTTFYSSHTGQYSMAESVGLPPRFPSVGLRLADKDLDTTGGPDLATVALSSARDSVVATLTENGGSSGIFVGAVPMAAALAGVVDGTLQAAHGDAVTISYSDAARETGGSGTVLSPLSIDAASPVALIHNPPYPSPDSWTGDGASFPTLRRLGTYYGAVEVRTDEPATARVEYGPHPSKLVMSEDSPFLGRNHTLILPSLDPNTTYYYRLLLADAQGNSVVDDNGGALYTFRTLEGAYVNVPGHGGYTYLTNGGGPATYAAVFADRPAAFTGRLTQGATNYRLRSGFYFDTYKVNAPAVDGATLELYGMSNYRPTRSGTATPWPWYVGPMPDADETNFRLMSNLYSASSFWNNATAFSIAKDDFSTNLGARLADAWSVPAPDLASLRANLANGRVVFKFTNDDSGYPSNSLGEDSNYVAVSPGHHNLRWQGREDHKLAYPQLLLPTRSASEGVVDIDRPVFAAGEFLHVTVSDSDLDTDPTTRQSVSIGLAASGGDSESLLLKETAPGSGIFDGTTRLRALPRSAGNGNLEAGGGETLTATYAEASPAGSRTDTATAGISDATPPTISGATLRTLMAGEEADALFTWTTSESAMSWIEWGSAAATYGAVRTGRQHVTSHLILLDDLPRADTVFYRISAMDESGNVATVTGSFAAPAEVVVSGAAYHPHTGPVVAAAASSRSIFTRDWATGTLDFTSFTLSGTAEDGHSADGDETQQVYAVEYYVDGMPPHQEVAGGTALAPGDGSFNTLRETYTGAVSVSTWADGEHQLLVRARGPNSVWGGFTRVPITVQTAFPLALKTGWNLVSSPLVNDSMTLGGVAAQLAAGEQVALRDAASGSLITHTKGSSAEALTRIPRAAGFWINTSADKTINLYGSRPAKGLDVSLTLAGGKWNAVGLLGDEASRKASWLNFSLSGGYAKYVLWWDAALQKWAPAYSALNPSFSDFTLLAGRGYYVSPSTAATLLYDS